MADLNAAYADALKRIAALEDDLAEIRETYMHVVAQHCAPDEQHCSCVPALRARIAALEAELDDARALIAKRAKIRVSVHDVWLRERKRREESEAERDALRADLKACAEALRVVPCACYQADIFCRFCTVLARPGVRAILEAPCSPA